MGLAVSLFRKKIVIATVVRQCHSYQSKLSLNTTVLEPLIASHGTRSPRLAHCGGLFLHSHIVRNRQSRRRRAADQLTSSTWIGRVLGTEMTRPPARRDSCVVTLAILTERTLAQRDCNRGAGADISSGIFFPAYGFTETYPKTKISEYESS